MTADGNQLLEVSENAQSRSRIRCTIVLGDRLTTSHCNFSSLEHSIADGAQFIGPATTENQKLA